MGVVQRQVQSECGCSLCVASFIHENFHLICIQRFMFEGHCICASLFLYICIPFSTFISEYFASHSNNHSFWHLDPVKPRIASVHVKYLNDEMTSYPNHVKN